MLDWRNVSPQPIDEMGPGGGAEKKIEIFGGGWLIDGVTGVKYAINSHRTAYNMHQLLR